MDIKIDIPDQQLGKWKVETFTVDRMDSVHSMFAYKGRVVKEGTYKRLMRNGTLVMSNTPAEIHDHITFIYKAKGNILINGLGLGVCLKAILGKGNFEAITIIEIDKELIDLIGPYYANDRVNIINDDAFNWKPPSSVRYDAVWHDVWDTICTDNIPEMTRLHRKYGKRTDWQGSWCKYECLRARNSWGW